VHTKEGRNLNYMFCPVLILTFY